MSKDTGKDGIDADLNKVAPLVRAKRELVLKSGESYEDSDKSKAKIELKGVGEIAEFSRLGYYLDDEELCIRDHITDNVVSIPRDFCFLRVVEKSLGDYK